MLGSQALLGLFVGVVPVAIGLMFYPALRGVGRDGMNFLLAHDGRPAGVPAGRRRGRGAGARRARRRRSSRARSWSCWPGRRASCCSWRPAAAAGTPAGLTLAAFIALGIGLHNLGEGLAIGAAFASGAAGLGTFLVLGFTLHNITEGIGIAAPMLKVRPPLWSFPALTLLAGGPAVLGLWVGSLAYAPQWSALALAIGAGAILQVVVEVSAYLARSDGRGRAAFASWPVMTGLALGVALMYVTAMLVKI